MPNPLTRRGFPQAGGALPGPIVRINGQPLALPSTIA
jgi:hypothetical protein